jgi:hypothetical protein
MSESGFSGLKDEQDKRHMNKVRMKQKIDAALIYKIIGCAM